MANLSQDTPLVNGAESPSNGRTATDGHTQLQIAAEGVSSAAAAVQSATICVLGARRRARRVPESIRPYLGHRLCCRCAGWPQNKQNLLKELDDAPDLWCALWLTIISIVLAFSFDAVVYSLYGKDVAIVRVPLRGGAALGGYGCMVSVLWGLQGRGRRPGEWVQRVRPRTQTAFV